CSGHTNRVTGVAFSPDGKSLASCSWDLTARLWDAAAGKQVRLLRHHSWLEGVFFSPDGKLLAVSGGWGDRVHLWDLTVKKDAPRWAGQQRQSLAVAFRPD